ncbi:hypothetical protein NE857_26215 [Nocardiopsis exhalans]|uniref:Uncharacterized protein n=2 Tax=Nocardiopsis TaxID=2013 RepID=A0A840W8C3_9ACTN|nr:MULTISPECIES: hypothetical protein [Nocardiopsis]MBB5492292.1 hypothetical protein [Nocardiopsis metallicus]USY18747.1 hypothetical protein NE857_26215 [Nocardiopsis exhalans]
MSDRGYAIRARLLHPIFVIPALVTALIAIGLLSQGLSGSDDGLVASENDAQGATAPAQATSDEEIPVLASALDVANDLAADFPIRTYTDKSDVCGTNQLNVGTWVVDCIEWIETRHVHIYEFDNVAQARAHEELVGRRDEDETRRYCHFLLVWDRWDHGHVSGEDRDAIMEHMEIYACLGSDARD